MAGLEPFQVVLPRAGPIVIRSAEPSDAAAMLAHIRAELDTHEYSVTMPDEFDRTVEEQEQAIREIAQREGCICLLALRDDAIIGILHFKNHPRRRMAHHGHFGIGVSQAWRGRGVGRALITTLLDWASATDVIEKVCLGVFATNHRAINLYASLGFAEEGRRIKEFKLGPGRYVDDIQMSIWVKPIEGATPLWRANNPAAGGGGNARAERTGARGPRGPEHV